MLNAKGIVLSLVLFATAGCDASREKEGDFDLSCSRWDESIIMCEDYVETPPLTGNIKIWYFKDDPYYGTNLFLCGGDLELNTNHPFEDYVAGHATKGEMLCSDAEKDEIEWVWGSETCLNMEWDNLYLEVEIPECLYDDKICIINGFGYISVE